MSVGWGIDGARGGRKFFSEEVDGSECLDWGKMLALDS